MPDDLRPPYKIQFDNARDPYAARNALGIPQSVISGGGGGGGGAPVDAEYITAALNATLTNERVLTNTASVTWDFSTPGQAKANVAASGGGNVSNSGTPTAGQYAKWVTATTIQGVAPAMVLADIGGQPAGSYQPLDADLTAIAALTGTNTIYYRSAANTWTAVTIGGNLTFTGGTLNAAVGTADLSGFQPLDADLTSLAAASATNAIYYRSAANTWATVTVSTGLSFTGGVLTCTVSTAGSQPLDATLTALAAYNTNGLLTQTAADTFTGRSIAVPAAGISITNANGVSGNPTLALANDLAALEALTGTNTIYYRSGSDTWSAVVIGSNMTFSGGTLNSVAGGGGNVSNSGTPAANDVAQWVTATTIKGVSLAIWRTAPTFSGITTFSGGAGANHLTIEGRPAAQNVWIRAQGADTNVGISHSTKGLGGHFFYTNDFSQLQINITHTASANTYLILTGGVGRADIYAQPLNPVYISNAFLTASSRADTPTADDNSTRVATTALIAARAISTTTIASGTAFVDITLPAGFSVFEVDLVHIVQNDITAGFNMQVAVNGVLQTGASYYSEYMLAYGGSVTAGPFLGQTFANIGGGVTSVATPDRSGRINFYPDTCGISGRGIDWISTTRVVYAGDGTTMIMTNGGYIAAGATARATALRFYAASGTLVSGKILLRGIV